MHYLLGVFIAQAQTFTIEEVQTIANECERPITIVRVDCSEQPCLVWLTGTLHAPPTLGGCSVDGGYFMSSGPAGNGAYINNKTDQKLCWAVNVFSTKGYISREESPQITARIEASHSSFLAEIDGHETNEVP